MGEGMVQGMFTLALLQACALPCDWRWGADRLACQFDAAVSAPSKEALLAEVDGIEDATTRDAAILAWIADHRANLKPEAAADLCRRLPPGEQGQCQRRATAAHLSR